jgi:hypothetical protein
VRKNPYTDPSPGIGLSVGKLDQYAIVSTACKTPASAIVCLSLPSMRTGMKGQTR